MSFASLQVALQATTLAAKALSFVAAVQAFCPPGHLDLGRTLTSVTRSFREIQEALPQARKKLPLLIRAVAKSPVAEIVEELSDEGYTQPRDHALILQEINGCKVLLLEVVRRAAYDWVLYRTSRRLHHKRLAEDAYTWLFVEMPGHPHWAEREHAGKHITSFLGICHELELDVDTVRSYVRKLTVRNVMSVGRPAEYRRRATCQPSMNEEHTPALSAGSWQGLEGSLEATGCDEKEY